jgi:NADPH:quinone reductase-like Zn-dependent oxidoreductase
VTRADIYQVQGKYPPPEGASPLPGLEVSGEIVALGSAIQDSGFGIQDSEGGQKADSFSARQRLGSLREAGSAAQEQLNVCALLEGGGYAEYVVVPATQVMPVPAGWSLAEAAALPETLLTNWLALVETAALSAGETVLIHGGSSGIGSFGITLAKLRGTTVITTAGSDAKTSFCLARGADKAINYKQQDFATQLASESIDIILDMVGGEAMATHLKLLKRGGRLVQIAFQQGAKAELNMAALLFKNLRWQGITLRNQSRERKADLVRAAWQHCQPWLDARQLVPPLDSEFLLQDAEKAHAKMQQNLHLGKIVLKVGT